MKTRKIITLFVVLFLSVAFIFCQNDTNNGGNNSTYGMYAWSAKSNTFSVIYGSDSIPEHNTDNLYFIPGTKTELQTIFKNIYDKRYPYGDGFVFDPSDFLKEQTLSQIENYIKTNEFFPNPGYETAFSAHSTTILNKLKTDDCIIVSFKMDWGAYLIYVFKE